VGKGIQCRVGERAQVHYILDEIVMGGMVLETNIAEIMDGISEMSKLEAATRGAGIKA
jgi:hypothetical protein